MQPSLAREGSVDRLGDLRRARLDMHVRSGTLAARGGLPGGPLQLADRPVDRIPVGAGRHLAQRAQRGQQRQRLIGSEPQRPGQVVRVVDVDDAVTLGRLDVDLDQIAHLRTRKPAEPQHLQIRDDLLRPDAELLGDVVDPCAVVLSQVRHQGEQPLDLVTRIAHTPATVRSRHSTPSSTSPGPSTTASGPYDAISSASTDESAYGTCSRSQPSSYGSMAFARRRRLTQDPVRARTFASDVGLGGASSDTSDLRSVPSGTLNAAGSPTVFTSPVIRDSRNIRVASRSRSLPTTYHRPCQDTMPHGSSVRVIGSDAPLRKCWNRTACRATTADHSGSNAGSDAPT